MLKKEIIFLKVLDDHKLLIYKVARGYCHDETDLQDLIQEISIQIWRSLDRYDERYKWSTWIYRIALNVSISHYRRDKRKLKTTQLTPLIEPASESKAQQESNEKIELLQGFIRELREIDRALIILHLEGLSSEEIAEILDTSQTNITTKISRIKQKLKERFRQLKS